MRECLHHVEVRGKLQMSFLGYCLSCIKETEFLTDFEQLGCLANELGEFPVSFPTLG